MLRAGPFRSPVDPASIDWARLALAILALAGALCSLAALARPGLLPFDDLSACFLLAASLAGTADAGRAAALRLAAVALCVAAPDPFLLASGFELACVLSGRAIAGAVPLLAAAALLGGPFDAVRAHGTTGTAAVAVLGLGMAGTLPRAGAVAPVLPVAGLYVLARTLDLCGAGAPGWWGLVLLPCGAALAAWAGWRAVAEGTVTAVGLRLFQAGLGVALAALGVAAAARGLDLPELAGLAVSGFLATVVAQAAGLAVLGAASRTIVAEAGTAALSRLGGLAGSMPRTAAALAVAAASLAALPPFAGFAGAWLSGQAMLALPRGGTPGVVLAVSEAASGLAAGCGLAAVLRLLATACLGRPRMPRSSAAQDPAGLRGWWPVGAAVLLVLAGLATGPLVSASSGAVRLLSGGPVPAAGWLMPVLALLLAGFAAIAAPFARRRRVAAWSDGRGPPPPWLPFGDPAEQWSAAAFAAPFRWPWPSIRPPALRWPYPRSALAQAAWLAALLAGFALWLA